MNGSSESDPVSEAGRDGPRIARPVSGQPRRGKLPAKNTDDISVATEKSIREWEAAYRKYGHASELVARSIGDDLAAAWGMASASWQVAQAWRELAAAQRLPWWLLAAVESAAEAFEAQARDWEVREEGRE